MPGQYFTFMLHSSLKLILGVLELWLLEDIGLQISWFKRHVVGSSTIK